MKKKINDFLACVSFIALLVFASGMDHATVFSYIGLAICALHLGVFALVKVRRQK